MTLRIGSLFTGTGALDLAVMDVYDADVVWHSQYEPPDKNGKEDKNQYAAKILARHWPTVPNLGDVTAIDWPSVIEEHGPVDIVTGGFPCTDVSSAGKRAGLNPDTRSGLWNHMAYAISILQPKLVVIENVEGLLSAPAASDMEPCPDCVGDRHAGPVLRACGAVLGDLASLGFDAEWGRFGADEVGAPHRRRRIIIRAWPTALHPSGVGRGDRSRIVGGLGTAGRDTEAPADAPHLGHERDRDARRRGNGPTDGGLSAANTHDWRAGEEHPGAYVLIGERAPQRGRTVQFAGPDRGGEVGLGGTAEEPAAHREAAAGQSGDRREIAAHPGGILPGDDGELPPGRHPVQRGLRHDAPRCGAAPTDANERRRRADVLQLRPGQPDLDWGDYEPAIRRWERVLGRPAPWPTDAVGRLSPAFTEWLMGLPDGWVTDTPGLTRPAMLRALGNGVVRQQAAAALRALHQRAADDNEAAA